MVQRRRIATTQEGAAPAASPNKTIDKIVGERMKQARIAAGLSQVNLAKRLGVSYQQYQKYESGENRMTIGRLWAVANALKMPISQFFDPISASDEDIQYAHTSRQALEAFNALPAHRRTAFLSLMRDETQFTAPPSQDDLKR